MNQGQLYNPITRCFNCVYHGNGGDSEKQQFESLYKQFYGNGSPMLYIPTTDYKILDDDIKYLGNSKIQEMFGGS